MTSLLVPNSIVVGFIVVIGLLSCQYDVAHGAVPPRNRDYSKQNDLEPITLEDVLEGKLGARGFSGSWVEGSDNLIRIYSANSVDHYNIEDGTTTARVNLTELTAKVPDFSNLIFSNDGKFALVEHGRSNLWRYSTLAKYDIFDLETKTLTPLVPKQEEEQQRLQLVKWSPNGNGIAFVFGYNIYYRKDASPQTPVRQITQDGADGENGSSAIYNGIADWVYEEEMFGGPTAMWISPSGSNLAFIKFDDTNVMEFQWPVYGEPGSNESYPEYRKIRYPKAGTPNPTADVYIISLTDESSSPVKQNYPETVEADRHIIGTAQWATDAALMVATLNRVQTKSQWHLCTSGNCNKIYSYELEHGWVDMNTPKVSTDGKKFMFVRSQPQGSSGSSYNHIVMFKDDKTSTVITTGQLSVGSILGWDETNKVLYFSGSFWNTTHADPTENQIYSVSDDGQNTVPKCITCGMRNSNDGLCRENSAVFSGKFTYFIHRCGGPDVPESTTRQTANGQTVDNPGPTFVNNAALRAVLETKAVPITREYDNIPVEGGFTARVMLYLPADYEESKKYPLLVSVYGGPGSQALSQTYGISWETSLVSSKNIIFAKIDGRGTSKQSTEHMFTLHRKLGTAEMEDQITVAKWLIANVPQIDANRTSIWGWSYGGYATAKVLEKDTEQVYKCGISVAPVTNWRYYDTIYTERYMGLPTAEDNYNGYNESDVTTHVENLRNKQYMLVHGNADDNVHYQQSMILARAMEKADIFFYQLSYPDENHGIGGPGMRKHLYHSLEKFLFNECYQTGAATPGRGDDGNAGSGASPISNSIFAIVTSCLFMIYRWSF